MVGIISYGAYIPLYRLSRAEIAKVWGGGIPPGEKAVANYDEDSITMAVAASIDCLRGIDREQVDSLYFASTTSPYKEKQAAALIAAVLGLHKKVFTVDFSSSIRSGTNAIRAALDSIAAGSAKKVLVCVSDTRLGLPAGEKEMAFGDGAAAFLLGSERVAVSIERNYAIADEIIDVWRSDKDIFVRSWEDRFVREEGYNAVVAKAVSAALKEYNLSPKDFSKVVFYAPNPRELAAVTGQLGFDIKTQVQDSLYNTVGNTGAALAAMMLVATLEEAKPGDRILLANYGDGCDIYVLSVTKEVGNIKERRGIKGHLSSKIALPSYERYLRWREIVPVEPPARPPLGQPSPVSLWRDRKGGLALYGVKCKQCGTPQYPRQRVCIVCHTKDQFEDYCFADKRGKITTFSHDNLGPSLDPPSTIAVVDFEGGGRIICDMTDRDFREVKIGIEVEMTFRKLHYVGGIYNYWWKCQPIRC